MVSLWEEWLQVQRLLPEILALSQWPLTLSASQQLLSLLLHQEPHVHPAACVCALFASLGTLTKAQSVRMPHGAQKAEKFLRARLQGRGQLPVPGWQLG